MESAALPEKHDFPFFFQVLFSSQIPLFMDFLCHTFSDPFMTSARFFHVFLGYTCMGITFPNITCFIQILAEETSFYAESW